MLKEKNRPKGNQDQRRHSQSQEKKQPHKTSISEDSAEKIEEYLNKMNLGKADYIISAIPFVAFPDSLALSIIQKCKESMKNNALFVQVHYSLLTKKFYQSVFGNVDVNFVPLNIPPAFVLVSEKMS